LCCKTKNKALTLTNHSSRKQHNESIKSRSKYIKWRKARENARNKQTIDFGFTSDWLRKWREFFNQSQSQVKQNQSKPIWINNAEYAVKSLFCLSTI